MGEGGTHGDLTGRDGFYCRLYEFQRWIRAEEAATAAVPEEPVTEAVLDARHPVSRPWGSN